MVVMCRPARRAAMRSPTPGMSEKGRATSGAGMSWGCQIVMPLGLSTLHAIFARSRFAAMPMLHVICSPTFLRSRSLMRVAIAARIRARGLVERARELVDLLHDVDGDLCLDLAQQRQMRATDQVGPLRHEDDVRTNREHVRHAHHVLHAEASSLPC